MSIKHHIVTAEPGWKTIRIVNNYFEVADEVIAWGISISGSSICHSIKRKIHPICLGENKEFGRDVYLYSPKGEVISLERGLKWKNEELAQKELCGKNKPTIPK